MWVQIKENKKTSSANNIKMKFDKHNKSILNGWMLPCPLPANAIPLVLPPVLPLLVGSPLGGLLLSMLLLAVSQPLAVQEGIPLLLAPLYLQNCMQWKSSSGMQVNQSKHI